ncbi:MAG: BamA/TamA family outer membrane protein [Holophagaceae bacterium]|uniref:BamA/TamA family outer membrane protein n=1 Tax=Candidatus Geothrix skivensis TaxID=2954439 RepID=A0A9D7SJZ9_9BACT|nr:BamA/TamA family outer membrane protein [Candidatus Geothrix skivensis]
MLASAMVVLAMPLQAARPTKPWNALEARKATLSRIDLEIGDVFDLTKRDENTWIGRTANHLHATTREAVIRRVLLFAEGEPVRVRRIYETERLLRALPFVKNARIDPVVQPDGTVVAVVKVRDAWTTQVDAGFSSVGGQKTMNFGIDEKNFLGTGKSVAYDLSKNHERTTWGLAYGDPQLFGSRWTLAAHTQYHTDGFVRSLVLERPFFALDTPWSTGLALSHSRSSLYLYDEGVEVFQAPFLQNEVRLSGAKLLRESGDRVWRGGLLLKRQDTSYGLLTQTGLAGSLPPPALIDRRLRGPALTFATQEDAFLEFENLQGMDSPEDYNLAWTGSLELGTYSRAWGSTLAAPFFKLQAAKGWSSSAENLTLFTAAWEGRKPSTGLEDSRLALSLVRYHKLAENQILAGLVAVDRAQRPDPEHWYYLGGDQGMRGFPNQLHPGDARWLASFDYRYLTEQRWLGLVRLGFSAFVDLGSVHRLDGQGWSRTYADVGIGLRLGNLKSAVGRVILLSVAAPLNREPYQERWQFTVGNAMRF